MNDVLELLWTTASRLDLRAGLDIVVVGLLFFGLFMLIRGTAAMALLRGMLLLYVAAFVVGTAFQLTMLQWLLRNSLPALLVAVPVLFQPELRRALERLGRTTYVGSHRNGGDDRRLAVVIGESARRLASRRHGAIIVIERETGLRTVVDTGVAVDGLVTPDLLCSIFFPSSPLHDGAVIVRGGRVAAAGCTLPLSDQTRRESANGTRHRAAIGITEGSDAVAVVVSEESGSISVASNGHLQPAVDPDRLAVLLHGALRRSGSDLVPFVVSRSDSVTSDSA